MIGRLWLLLEDAVEVPMDLAILLTHHASTVKKGYLNRIHMTKNKQEKAAIEHSMTDRRP